MRLGFEEDVAVNDLELEFSTRSDVEGVGDRPGDTKGKVPGGSLSEGASGGF
jgi:hypothetical protein